MSSNDKVAQLEVQLQRAGAKRAAQKAAEKQQIAAEKEAAEARWVEEERRVAEWRSGRR